MAAALRYAARRLGGRVLQRQHRIHTAAAEDNQGGRAVWPTSSRRSSPSASSGAATASGSTKHACTKSAAEPLDQKSKEYLANAQVKKIDDKKEELFHLIAKLDSQFPSHCDRNNRQLLMDLSVYVQPKPDDPQWRFYRRARRLNEYLIVGSVLYITYLYLASEISKKELEESRRG